MKIQHAILVDSDGDEIKPIPWTANTKGAGVLLHEGRCFVYDGEHTPKDGKKRAGQIYFVEQVSVTV